MSFAEVQNEVLALSADERKKLAGLLTVLRMKETGEWKSATGAESHSDRWISLEEAQARLLGGR